MAGIDERVIWECSGFVDGFKHLGRRAFKDPAAASAEKQVTAEQPFLGFRIIGDVSKGVARDIQYGKLEPAQCIECHSVAFFQWMGDGRDSVVCWSIDRDIIFFQQVGNATGMVIVLMGQQDAGKFQLALLEGVQHRCGITGIDQNGL